MAMYQVQMVNNVKTLVPVSGDVNTDSVTDNDMHPVTSNAVAKAVFPDYSSVMSIPSGTSWIATKDCYMQLFVISSVSTKTLKIDNVAVNVLDDSAGSNYFYSLCGYIKKGQVVTWSDNLNNQRSIKIFACE